jgi:hypothetical protein
VAILFDFTFVHSIFASAYSAQGGHCYDPASLFVLLVFAFVNGYEYLSDFVADLHDPYRGHQYRVLAGISTECVPQEAVPIKSILDFGQRTNGLGEPLPKA